MKQLRIVSLLGLVLLSLPALAEQPKHLTWKIDGKEAAFVRFEASRLTISAGCLKPEGYLKCDASRALSKATLTGIAPDRFRGGKNPGSVVCQEIRGSVVFGVNRVGESSFCKFKDGSSIEVGSLYAAAAAKEGK